MSKIIVILEGNVASGKTTLGEYLASNISGSKFYEEKWDKESQELKKFYSSKNHSEARFNLISLQLWIINRFTAIFSEILEDEHTQVHIVDRGILGSIAFIKAAAMDGIIPLSTAKEMVRLIKNLWREMIIKQFVTVISVFVNTAAETCYKRFIIRDPSKSDKKNPIGDWEGEIRINLDLLKLQTIEQENRSMLKILNLSDNEFRPFGSHFYICSSDAPGSLYIFKKIKQIINA